MDYPTVTARMPMSESEAAAMAARRTAAGVSLEEADQQRRETLGASAKSLKELFSSGIDVVAYGVMVPHWTRGTRR
jgi:D-mannonate dehydratase